jgi:hypothetical protein
MELKPKQEIENIIKDNWLTKTNEEIGNLCGGLSSDSIRKRAMNLKLPKKGIKFGSILHRQNKIEKHEALKKQAEEIGIPIEDIKHYWHKGEHFSIFAKNKEIGLEELKEEIINQVKKYAPKYPILKYPKYVDAHLLVISPADVHINKLCSAFETGDEYTIEIAVNRVKEGVLSLLKRISFYNVDKILFIIGNDILHTDNPKSTTTSGTLQDTQIMWYDAFMVAKKLLIEVIEMLLNIAPMQVQYNSSNHDYMTGFLLAQTIEAWFNKTKNISFNVGMEHRKYFVYGKNLIGTTHGDGAKETDLALLMAHESKFWNDCKHRYYYIHHIHHKKSKDYMSVCVEALRSPSGTDSWHHRNGYQYAPKAIEAFLHHKEFGQIARFTHLF